MKFDAGLSETAVPVTWKQFRRLAQRAEGQSPEPHPHMDRVGRLTTLLARASGWSSEAAELLGQAALLHDIGKVTIPAHILQKPGPLTPAEFDLVKTHCRAGANLLRGPTPFQQLAAEIALSHHERWDGRGYPQGLVGEAIPLSARIVAVADVFDALTRDRPYKAAWSRRKAACEISAQAGRHFDPAVVAAFQRVLGLTLH